MNSFTNDVSYYFTVKAVNEIDVGMEGSTVGFSTPKRPQSVDSFTISGVTTTGASFKTSYISDDTLTKQGFIYKKSTDNDSSWQEVPTNVYTENKMVLNNFVHINRRYMLIDAPGHIEFLENMATGAGTAEAARKELAIDNLLLMLKNRKRGIL